MPVPLPDGRGRSRARTRLIRLFAGAVVAAGLAGSGVALAAARHRASSVRPAPQAFQGSNVRAPDGVRVTVEVFNTTSRHGLGRRATLYLRDQGFDVVTLGTASPPRDTTVVIARSRHPDWAQLVSRALGDARMEMRPDSSRDVDVSVYIGTSWRPPAQPFYP
jgi:hypothetical protein